MPRGRKPKTWLGCTIDERCGTRNGYVASRRAGVTPCAACKAATATYVRNNYRYKRGTPLDAPVQGSGPAKPWQGCGVDPRCGTYAGYQAALRARAPRCQACKDANTAYRHNRQRINSRKHEPKPFTPYTTADGFAVQSEDDVAFLQRLNNHSRNDDKAAP